tara:strand:+ start:544 stop:1092 length:549 start_codon:yes stop_codon:yes gene_type:complete
MSAITSGWLNQCTDGTCAGGIGKFYVANANQVTGITTNASGATTAITMTSSAAVFYEVEFRDNSGAFTETVTQDADTLSVAIEQSLTGIINCRDQELRNLIQDMANQACGLVLVHVENTGNYWIWGAETVGGKKRVGRLTSAEGLSGALFTDSNQETLTITCRTTNKARFIVDGATVMGALD